MIPEKHEAARDSDFRRPHNQRKSSFSDAINKLTATTFNRRRTTNVLPPSKSSTQFLHKSRLPTPSGVPRSSSFLSSLNKFTSRSSEHCTYPNENNPPLPPGKRSQNLSDRLAQTAFVHQRSTHSHIPATPVTPGNKRESSVKIEQRGLMQPMPPPLPRSSTMGDLLTPQTTSSAFDLASSVSRPASGSAERKGRLAMNKRENALSPPMRVVRLQNPPGGFPRRKDSLMPPPPARALATVQDVGCEASAAHDSSLDSEGIEEDTVLCVPRKEGQRTHHHESMIRKQKSSFREEFDTEHPRQGKKFDAEDAPLNERGRQTMQGESEETLTDPDDINDPCLVSLPFPVISSKHPMLIPLIGPLRQTSNLLARPLHRALRYRSLLSPCHTTTIFLKHYHFLLLNSRLLRSQPPNARRRPAGQSRLLAVEGVVHN